MDSTSNTTNSKSSDVSKLISLGFDEAQAIQALNEHGSLQGAIVSMTSGGADMRGRVTATVDGPASQSRSEFDAVDDPSQKLIDDHDNENKVSLPTDLDVATAAKSPSLPTKSDKGNNADAPSPSLPKAARVEQIEENEGPEPPVSMQPAFQNNSKKLSSLTARVEQVEDYDGPEPPLAMMTRFQDSDNKKSARFDNEPNRSSPLIGGRGQDVVVSGTMETADPFLSFDSLEGQNFFRDNTNNITTNNERTRGENESVHQRNAALRFPRQINGVDPNIRSGPVDKLGNTVVADEEKSNSVNSKSDSDQQEEYVAIIPEAFLVEEEVDGEIIQATLIEPTPPWWKMRRMQLMLSIVIILVLALSIYLGRDKNRSNSPNSSEELVGATQERSMLPSIASDTMSPSVAPACSLDSNCGANLEVWEDIVGSSITELRFYTNVLRNKPNETIRLWSLLEAPTNFGENYGSRIKGWLMPPVTGNYTFWIASDDYSEFWMSTDDNPRNVELICFLYGWVSSGDWSSYSTQESLPVWLAADKAYYFQALLKEGVNQDHLAVAWKYPGQDEMQVIPAEYSQISGPTTYEEEIIPMDSFTPTVSSQNPVNCSIDTQCGAILETWTGIEGSSTVDLVTKTNFFVDMPDKTERLWEFLEVPSNEDENYGDVMEGWLMPPVTGDYIFWIASDDNGEFFFNKNYGIGYVDNDMGKICYTPYYSGVREWDQSREQKSDPIPLVKDQPYFFQICRKQGVNENHLAVAWEYPGQAREVIPAKYSRTTTLAFSCFDCGASLETWKDISGWSIDDLRRGTENFQVAPSNTDRLWTLLESQSNLGEFLGQRMKGWLMPPVTGDFTFWISSDDQGELWLSTDDNPENMFLACKAPAATPSREFKWFYHQQSSPIKLVAGKAYYFEALMKQGITQHSLAIAWQYPGQELQVIPAKHTRVTNPSTCRDSYCGAILTTWTGVSGLTIDDLTVGTNDYEEKNTTTDRLKSLLEIVPDQGENYGVRLAGWLLPPVSGNYTFLIASDDASEFWLSTDDDPANKDLICNCSRAVPYREWDLTPEQRSPHIQLVRGHSYYFEGLMKEGRSRDHFSIAWEYPGQNREVIPAKFSRTTRQTN